MLAFLTLLLTTLSGCGTTVSSCSIDTGLIVDSQGVVRPSSPVDNQKLLKAIKDANDERDVDNVRKAQLRRQVGACVTGLTNSSK